MKTIKAKNGEWVNLSNQLPELTKVQGKTFALAIAKNTMLIKDALLPLEGILAPTEKFAELSEKVKEYQNKKDKISLTAIKKLEQEYKEDILARQAQINEVNKILEQEIEIELEQITEEMFPETITAQQILSLKLLK